MMMMIDAMPTKTCLDVGPLLTVRSGSEQTGTPPVLSIESHVRMPNINNRTDAAKEEWSLSSLQDSNGVASSSNNKEISAIGLSSFPFRLHDMLNDATKKGFEDVVCWRNDDRSFLIRDKDRFAMEVLPNYFQGQTHYKSFQRQLNIYGFTRVVGGTRRDMGTYTHRLLVRGEAKLCRYMIRTKIKNKGARTRKLQHAQSRAPQQPSWNLVAALPTTMSLDDNTGVATMASIGDHGTVPGNDSNWQYTNSLAVACKISSDNDELVASTKRLQVLEERSRNVLKLLEMRLSLLEMKTLETANVDAGLSSQHPIDPYTPMTDRQIHTETVGLWNLDVDLLNMGGPSASTMPKSDETLEEMEHLDNIFNFCDSLSHGDNTTFPIPLELFASSGEMGADNIVSAGERALLLEQKQAMYPDVAAELVRIFG